MAARFDRRRIRDIGTGRSNLSVLLALRKIHPASDDTAPACVVLGRSAWRPGACTGSRPSPRCADAGGDHYDQLRRGGVLDFRSRFNDGPIIAPTERDSQLDVVGQDCILRLTFNRPGYSQPAPPNSELSAVRLYLQEPRPRTAQKEQSMWIPKVLRDR